MEKLLKLAAEEKCEAELFSHVCDENRISLQNGLLQDIESNYRAGLSLRIIRDGKLGFAFTKNLTNRKVLLQNALDSLKGGVEAPFSFPLTSDVPELDNYNPSIEEVTNTQIVEEANRISENLRGRTTGEVHINAGTSIDTIRLMNTAGTDLSTRFSDFGIGAMIVFPGSAADISADVEGNTLTSMPDEVIDEVADTYASAESVVEIQSGNMPVMFMPGSMITLSWRIGSGLNAKSIYEKTSPLTGKLGETIWSDKLTIYNDPSDCRFPTSRAFDDEGLPCGRFPLVEKGVLKNIFTDLNYAGKLGIKPSGHGFRSGMWGGDPSTLKPIPSLTRMMIEPGTHSLDEMIKLMDRGLILHGVLGPHSGNIAHGDFSVGVCPGLYVENGKVIGRVKDAMVAGNIYEMFNNVIAIGSKLYPVFRGKCPALLFDNVSVAAH